MGSVVQSWRRCVRCHEDYTAIVERIHLGIGTHPMAQTYEYQRVRRRLRRLLNTFHRRIEDFRPHFEGTPGHQTFGGLAAKVRWAGLTSWLRKIRDDMDAQLEKLRSLLAVVPELQNIIEAGVPSARQEYYAVLVTTPPRHLYGPFVDTFCAAPYAAPAINWGSPHTHALPSMLDSLVFRRHFALCLVVRETWESDVLPLRDKFRDQRFWNYYGNSKTCSRGELWSPFRISDINAIKVLGIVNSPRDAVAECSDYHYQLRRNWKYRNIWWNDADFALCLTGLMVDDVARATCGGLYHRLGELRETTIVMARRRMGIQNSMIGWCGCVVMGGITIVTLGASAPVTGPGFVGFWAYGAGSAIATEVTESVSRSRRAERAAAQARLMRTFPALQRVLY